jgi:RNA polymerase sigma-70 factor (ECF subfamily)
MFNRSQSAGDIAPLIGELYTKSAAAEYGLDEGEFTSILAEVAAKYLAADAPPSESQSFYMALRVEELALARACVAGNEKAWEVFLTRYRAKLYEMAGAIAKDDSVGRELADSLYAELYGLHTRGDRRVSKFSYYMGRGSLEGWLRTLLAQDYVDRYRRQKRLVSLEEQEEQHHTFAATPAESPALADPRLVQATDAALAALPAEDRFILAAYFLDGRTLAEIARMLRVHESTISRKVDKLTRQLRENIIKRLMSCGFGRRAAEEALEIDVRDLAVDVKSRLQGTAGTAFNSKEERSAAEGKQQATSGSDV